jgi:hypothetical protein
VFLDDAEKFLEKHSVVLTDDAVIPMEPAVDSK